MDERTAKYWLCNIDGIGNAKRRALLHCFKNVNGVLSADREELSKMWELSSDDVDNILSEELRDKASEDYKALRKKGVKMVFWDEGNYPDGLKEIYDRPHVLYYTGALPDKDMRLVAIVGSRKCSVYGQSMATEIAAALATRGIGIVSGMAMGIDSCAHKGALYAGGCTYGVLAADPTKPYPPQNFNLYMDILQRGGIMSEYGPGTATVPGLFPMRNRIISGLCEATIVIEAGERSGSLITAAMALEQNRRVIALPGRISDVCSRGCNMLISQGAEVITSVEELLSGFDLDNDADGSKNNLVLAREEKMLYSLLLDFTPRNLEELSAGCKLSPQAVFSALISLELKGVIREISKNYYVRIL